MLKLMQRLTITTHQQKEVVDISEDIEKLITVGFNGWCLIFVHHTTCSVTTADLDPGTDEDLLEAIEGMIPDLPYRHPHNPRHVGDHIMSSLIGPSLVLPIREGVLIEGTWQRIVLVELDGPKDRSMTVDFWESR